MTSIAKAVLGGTGTGILLFAVPLVTFVVVVAIPSPGERQVTALCDEAVQALLVTRDAVELDRAKFLIRWFNCSIRRRLP